MHRVMRLKSRRSRDVLLRWRIYTPASFKDSRAASDGGLARAPTAAFARACTRRRNASAEHGAYVLRNFELGFNEANDTAAAAARLLIRDNPNVCLQPHPSRSRLMPFLRIKNRRLVTKKRVTRQMPIISSSVLINFFYRPAPTLFANALTRTACCFEIAEVRA